MADAPEHLPVRQMRAQVAEVVAQGKTDEAFELMFAALNALVDHSRAVEFRVKKLEAQLTRTSKSERIDSTQLSLMLEQLDPEQEAAPDLKVEAEADEEIEKEIAHAESESAGPDQPVTAADSAPAPTPPVKRTRRKAIRNAGLERQHTQLEIPTEQQDWVVVGEKLTERLRFSPASFFVEVIHRPVLRAPEDAASDGAAVFATVPASPSLIPGGMAGNDVVAMLLLRKFEEHMPMHRLHRQLQREQGLDLSVSTLCDWIEAGGEALKRLQPLLLSRATASFLVQTDATGLRVLDSGPDGIHRGTIWAFVGATGVLNEAPTMAFVYRPAGDGESGPWKVLAGRTGYIMADASNLFDRLYNGQVAHAIEVGCNAHGRRKLVELKDDPRVAYPLQLVRRLYRIERLGDAKRLTPEARTALRQARSRPVLDKLHGYLLRQVRDGTPKCAVTKAARYYIKHWVALTRFVDDGRLPIDNTLTERQFRGLRIGEHNYLFAGSDASAERIAAIYSTLATAKAHGLNLYEYLCDILDRLSYPMNEAGLADLLPHRWQPRCNGVAGARMVG